MIAIILDSNILFNDSLFNTGYLKRLLSYSNVGAIEILLSKVVIEETINNKIKTLNSSYTDAKKHIEKFNSVAYYKSIETDIIDLDAETKHVESEHHNRYSELSNNGFIKIIPYNNDLLPELLHRAIKKIRPFTEKKEEFRDAVIWLSCIEHLKNNNYEKAFFISNDITDFCVSKTNNELHNDLKKDHKEIKLCTQIKDLFIKEKEYFKSVIPEDCSEKLTDWLSQKNINYDYVQEYISSNLYDEFVSHANKSIEQIEPHEIDSEIYVGGYVQPTFSSDEYLLDKSSLAIQADLDCIIITGSVISNTTVEAYQYNPIHDEPEDEKFTFFCEAFIELEMEFIFSISPDKDEPYDFDITNINYHIEEG